MDNSGESERGQRPQKSDGAAIEEVDFVIPTNVFPYNGNERPE